MAYLCTRRMSERALEVLESHGRVRDRLVGDGYTVAEVRLGCHRKALVSLTKAGHKLVEASRRGQRHPDTPPWARISGLSRTDFDQALSKRLSRAEQLNAVVLSGIEACREGESWRRERRAASRHTIPSTFEG